MDFIYFSILVQASISQHFTEKRNGLLTFSYYWTFHKVSINVALELFSVPVRFDPWYLLSLTMGILKMDFLHHSAYVLVSNNWLPQTAFLSSPINWIWSGLRAALYSLCNIQTLVYY
jgi:hypothetical protein